jgi:hypothetical protein
MNRGLLLALLAICALLWLLALRRESGPTQHEGARPAPIAAEPRPPASPPEPPQPAQLPAAAPPPAEPASKPGPIAPQDGYRERLARQIAEQRKQNDARFAVASERWRRERRQEPWAKTREGQLRSALERDALDGLIGSLQCRETLCRISLAAQDSNAGVAVSRAHGFQQEVGPQVALGMTGGGLDRSAILFVARTGYSLDR